MCFTLTSTIQPVNMQAAIQNCIVHIPIMYLLFHGCRQLGSPRRICLIGFVKNLY